MAATHDGPSDLGSHEGNAARVALWLADALDAADCDAGAAQHLADAGWRLAALVARAAHPGWEPPAGYTPSTMTRSAVLAVLRDREATADDPFRGFPQ